MGFWVANLGPQYTPLLSGISDMDQSYKLHNWVCSRHQQVFPAVIGIVQYTSNVSLSLSLSRFVAVGRKLVVVCTLGTCTLIMNILLGGFIVAQNDIEPFMIWGYYISPVMYGQNALVINEFLDKRWSTPNPDPRIHAPTVGKVLLKSRGFFTDDYMFWVCVGALLGFSLLFNILFIAAFTFLNPLSDSKSIVLDEDVGKKNKKSSGRMTSEGEYDPDVDGLRCPSSHIRR